MMALAFQQQQLMFQNMQQQQLMMAQHANASRWAPTSRPGSAQQPASGAPELQGQQQQQLPMPAQSQMTMTRQQMPMFPMHQQQMPMFPSMAMSGMMMPFGGMTTPSPYQFQQGMMMPSASSGTQNDGNGDVERVE